MATIARKGHAKEDEPVFSTKVRAWLAAGAKGLRDNLLTHHHKGLSTSGAISTPVFDPWSVAPGHNSAARGISSLTVRAQSPIGLGYTGAEIAKSQELCREMAVEGYELPISPLELARRGDEKALKGLGLSSVEAGNLVSALQDLSETVPAKIDASLKQVFFEAGDRSVLVTPLYPVKFAHELNRRKGDLWNLRKDAMDPSRRKVLQGIGYLPVGGTKPQNAGYLVSKSGINTKFGGIPVLFFRSPSDNPLPETRRLRRLLAVGSLARLNKIDPVLLREYVARSKIALNLASHLRAEEGQAADIAAVVISGIEGLRKSFLDLDPAIWQERSWARIPKIEQPFLDPRLGGTDIDGLSTSLAGAIKQRLERMAEGRGEEAAGYTLPLRSFQNLIVAFASAIAELAR